MKCPKHLENLVQTEWLPKPGMDPFLYKYKCPKCGYTVYEIHKRQERRDEIHGQGRDGYRNSPKVPDVPAGEVGRR